MADKNIPIVCTYCGVRSAPWDEDHVPPQSIIGFDHSYKVPSCIRCNNGSSKDDEYFLFAVSMAKVCDAYPEIFKFREKVIRSLGKDKAKRYRDLILRNVTESRNSTNEVDFGNYLERIKAVAIRIVKGLYFLEHNGKTIPDTHQVIVFVGNEHEAYGSKNIEKMQLLFNPLKEVEVRNIGEPGVFQYLYSKIDDQDPYATVWYFRFYCGYEFIAHTLPNGDSRSLLTHFPAIHNLNLLPKLETIFVPSCGELSNWTTQQLGGDSKQNPNKADNLLGIETHGRLGKYTGPEKE
jgi:hypothetical protein